MSRADGISRGALENLVNLESVERGGGPTTSIVERGGGPITTSTVENIPVVYTPVYPGFTLSSTVLVISTIF